MAASATTGKLIDYLRDAHAMERSVLHMLNAMIATTSDDEMVRELEHHSEETERQIKRLEERLEAHGTAPSAAKDVPAVLGALLKGMGDVIRSDKPGKNARDGFVTEHLEIASYELLERLARRAGDEATARVALENKSEEEAMARKIASHWDKVVDLTVAG
jgi:ferritin-like metal-binding protein YciE